MIRAHLVAVTACIGVLAWAGCSRAQEPTEKENKAAPPPSVTFKSGRGLQLSAATLAKLEVKTVPAEERAVEAETRVVAQVYDAGPPARASVLVPEGDADRLAAGKPVNAVLQRTVRPTQPSAHLVELLFTLEAAERKIGEFVEVKLRQPEKRVLAVPRIAVIDGAAGPFVYVVNADYYLRTVVKLGAQNADWIEIADGLYAGDVVVTQGAMKLWLAEMLLTKGGGDID